MDITVKENRIKAKITNSKNEYATSRSNGIGIANVKKRLEFIYPGNHELKLNDEGHFFVVALMIRLNSDNVIEHPLASLISKPGTHETSLPAYR